MGLLLIVLIILYVDCVFGIFVEVEKYLYDLLNDIEYVLKYLVEIVLFLFGLCNVGVKFEVMGDVIWLVLVGLIIGKLIGVLIFGWFVVKLFGFGFFVGMCIIDLFVIGCVVVIGFIVVLFVVVVVFDVGLV